MKQNEIEDLPSLGVYRYENFFNVYTDSKNNQRFYNLIKSINLFPANNQTIEQTHTIGYHDTWISLSYQYYKTLDLWWLICAYNQILDASKIPEPGTQIKILNSEYVGYVLTELKTQLNN